MMLLVEPALVKLAALPLVKRLSMMLLLVPTDAIPTVVLPPREFDTIMALVPSARRPVPLLLQLLLPTTLSLPAAVISMPMPFRVAVLLTALAQAPARRIPTPLSWTSLSIRTVWVALCTL